MKKGNLYLIVGSMAAVFVLGWGCGRAPESGSGKRQIAVVPKGTAHEFWQTVHAGAKTAGQELGVEILWQGPQTETQYERQVNIVQDFITAQVDGIVLAPQDADALVPVIEQVDAAGIPLVLFDSGANTDKYASFVATDNYKGGQEAARTMASLLPNGGRVIIILVAPGSASTTEREKGFEDTIKQEFPNIQIVDKQYGYSDREKSRAVTEDLLTKYPDVEGVYGPNESSTFGALLALRAQGYAGKKAFIGFDSSPDLNDALRKGEINALVLQNPFKMGYEAVKAVVDHLDGKEVPKRIDTGVKVITTATMDEPENAKLLSPDLSILKGE
ncbi:MAG TPA: substrate-binding domain-containing protein [bacterium]|nr:substrate-binding domain-containing protein [bacterium]HQL64101.1 substrate-binding domain-containing protein [bacterium]